MSIEQNLHFQEDEP